MEVTVNFDYRKDDLDRIDIYKLFRLVMEAEGNPETSEASINFVDNETIAQLNERYRGVELVTDVLSFAINDDGEDDDELPEGAPFELGDIVIAPDVAEQQSQDFGTSFEEEICLLITHGLLHLCGYDHSEDDEAEEMEARERAVLSEYFGRPFDR